MTASAAGIHRRCERIVVGLGLALALAGCSKPTEYNPLGPSAVVPSEELASRAGGVNRHYLAAIEPTSVAAGSAAALSVTITNCDEAVCPGSPTSPNQAVRSAEVVVPAGFVATQVSTPTATGGKSWSATLVDGTIRLGANGGNQGLAAGESVTVTVSAMAPSSCETFTWLTSAYQDPLSAGQLPYALAGTQPQVAVTGCGESSPGCTQEVGHWQANPGSWPVASLTLGTVSYTAAQLLSILNQPAGTNGLIQLAHQLIAAKLNIADGADGGDVADMIAAADALIGALVVPPVGAGSLAPAQTGVLTGNLANYNVGFFGPGACAP